MNDKNSNQNKLSDEKSMYLIQHKDDPVHWWPMGKEAIQASKDQDKPIFLSLGYSSCHWCHVMAKESFQDQETADLMNEHFINIKVDREEFPDLDSFYQQACQLYTQNGGWPLSAFLMSDLKPFFVGTYFPPHPQKDFASFKQVLTELSTAYKKSPDTLIKNAQEVTQKILSPPPHPQKVEFEGHFPHPSSVMSALQQYQDNENGGYGERPKFPHFSFLTWASEQMLEGMINKENGGQHIVSTFERILMGGINDQSRGGFHRYSVDDQWLVPHFEKMLYDQAGLLGALSKFSNLYPSPLVYDTIIKTLEYLESEMFSSEGFFFSSQDSDSEGQEGLYFTFTEEEFEGIVNSCSEDCVSRLEQLKKWFQITPEGNFRDGLSVISLNHTYAKEFFTTEGWGAIREVRAKVVEERKDRIPPATDSKGVASWNFMMVTALADIIQYSQIDVIKKLALKIFNQSVEGIYKNFIISSKNQEMKIRHSTTKDETLSYFEDYVFFAESQLRVYEISSNEIFKDNCLKTISFILKEFVKTSGEDDLVVFTRSQKEEDLIYPNLTQQTYDNSFRSPLSAFIGLLRRTSIFNVFSEEELSIKQKLIETITNDSLVNPLAAGEALRTLTYPEGAYRIVKLPRTWVNNENFINFMNYFLPRFVLSYHDNGEKWEICNKTDIEIEGDGLENFMTTLRPSKTEE